VGARGGLHGIQLWVAQPEATRHGAPAFEHHAALPRVELDGGLATVMVGELAGALSPARRDTEHVGIELRLQRGVTTVPLQPEYEYAVVVLEGAVAIDGATVTPGNLGYLGLGRANVAVEAPDAATLILLGGVPFEAPLVMWWNFVGRSREEIESARLSWERDDGRFGTVRSSLNRIPAPPLPWASPA
jgi:redox-sensitive bicupin YhaK (pirin superfamily)